MKKIVILGVYFGRFPDNYELWLKSCKYNSTIDFKVFTDQAIKSNYRNLEYIHMDLSEFNNLMKEKIGDKYNILYPYKCCDFKPVYGVILEDYIKSYDFWGHCDFDMIFGNLRRFLNDDILKKYDKILPLGHLSLYRNTKEVNNRYKDKGSIVGDYDYVFSHRENVAFDEMNGIANIYYYNKYPFYDKRIFADISTIRKRFTLALKDKNYNNQVFYWLNCSVYRAFEQDGKIITEEFAYIHFKRRKYLKIKFDADKTNSFFICNDGFIKKDEGIPTIEDIKKYNKYPGYIIETFENSKYKIKQFFLSIKNKKQ